MLWRRHSVHGTSSCVIGTLPLCNRTRTLQPNHAQERNPPPAEAPAAAAKPPPEPKQPLPRPSIVEAWPPFRWPPFWYRYSLARAPPQGAPGGSGQLNSAGPERRPHPQRCPSPNAARTQAAATLRPKPQFNCPNWPMQARERELSTGRLDHPRARAARHTVPAVPRGAPQVHRGRGGRTLT